MTRPCLFCHLSTQSAKTCSCAQNIVQAERKPRSQRETSRFFTKRALLIYSGTIVWDRLLLREILLVHQILGVDTVTFFTMPNTIFLLIANLDAMSSMDELTYCKLCLSVMYETSDSILCLERAVLTLRASTTSF